MTDLPKEQIEALLDGTTPGPWRAGPAYQAIIADAPTGWDDKKTLSAYGGHLVCESFSSEANKAICIAAPDLARTCLSLYQRVEDAEAATAQCCICGKKGISTAEDDGPECELHDGRWVCSAECWEVASNLASDTGKAALAALRAERDELMSRLRWNVTETGSLVKVCRGDHDKGEDCEAHEERFVPEAERDTLAASLAAAQAEVTALREAIEEIAKQKTTDEIATTEDIGLCDFEEGYDAMIRVARAAHDSRNDKEGG